MEKAKCSEGYNLKQVNDHLVQVCAFGADLDFYNAKVAKMVSEDGKKMDATHGICEICDTFQRQILQIWKWEESKKRVAAQNEDKVIEFNRK